MSRFEFSDEFYERQLEGLEAEFEYTDRQLRAAIAAVLGGIVAGTCLVLADGNDNFFDMAALGLGSASVMYGTVTLLVNKCEQMFRRYDRYY